MRYLRFTFPLALYATLAGVLVVTGVAHAQKPSGPGRGITDIMRAAPTVPPARPKPAAAEPAGQRAAEYIVALVNSEPVTNTEVQRKVRRALANGGIEAERVPRQELERLALERIIFEKAQLQQAKELSIKVDDLAVDQAEQMVARQNQVSVDEVRRRVIADGSSIESFRAELRQQLLLQRLREREVEPRVKVSDLEVDQYLNAQRNDGRVSSMPPEMNIAQILVAIPENASDEQIAVLQKRAESVAARARAGEDFAALVREFSAAPERDNGGEMGLRSADRYPPLFVEALDATPVGGVVGPVKSDAGFHVLKLLTKLQPGLNPTITQTHVRHILLRPDAKRSTAQAVAELKGFKKRIENRSADFPGLARDNSQDGSAKDGGDLGWSRPGMFVPEFEEAMERLAPGQVSDPVVSRFGVHLIQVLERREAKLSPAEQREAARAALREKRLDEAYETWSQELRNRAFVEYREAVN